MAATRAAQGPNVWWGNHAAVTTRDLTPVPVGPSVPVFMAPAATSTPGERRPVEFAAAPASRVWIAVCVAAGAAILAGCLFFGLSELLVSVKRHVLEALF